MKMETQHEIALVASEEEVGRLRRLAEVVRYLTCLRTPIAKLSDSAGVLHITWRDEPSNEEKALAGLIWEHYGNEASTNVEHHTLPQPTTHYQHPAGDNPPAEAGATL
jgi:hypothetical protein